jgi:MFS family permease
MSLEEQEGENSAHPQSAQESRSEQIRQEPFVSTLPSSTSLNSVAQESNSTEVPAESSDGATREEEEGKKPRKKEALGVKICRLLKNWLIGPPSRWTLLLITTLASIMAAVQGSALIIALPTLMNDLDANIVAILWILNAYMLVIAIAVPLIGRMGDLFGRAFLFNLGFLVFALSSLLCGLAPVKQARGYDLVAYRILQGLGSSLLFANSTALVTDAFIAYGQLGIAMACNQMAFAAGNVVGPVVGGILSKASWKWIFLFNVPIGFVGFVFCIFKVRESNLQKMKKAPKKPSSSLWAQADAKRDKKPTETQIAIELKDMQLNNNQNEAKDIQETASIEKKSDDTLVKSEQNNRASDNAAQQTPEKKEQTNISVASMEQIVACKTSKGRKIFQKIKEIIFRLDPIGTIIFIVSITALLIALSDVAYPCVGLIARRVLFAVFGASIIAFIVFEWFWKSPLIDPRLFFLRPFLVGNIANSFMSFAQGSIMFSFIFFFQGPGGRSPLMAGVMLMPFGGTIMVFGLAAGFIADRIGSQLLCLIGLFISFGGALGMCFVNLETKYGLIALYFVLYGAGSGLFNSPNGAAVMACVPRERRGTSSGTRILLTMVFRAVSTSITFVLIFSKLSVQDIIQIFLVGGGVSKSVANAFMKEWHINLWISLGVTGLAWISTFFMRWDWIIKLKSCMKARKEAKKAALEASQIDEKDVENKNEVNEKSNETINESNDEREIENISNSSESKNELIVPEENFDAADIGQSKV